MAPDADCNPRYGQNARIQVTMTDAAGVDVVTATAPMNDAGGFTYSFEVPAGTAAGESAITAMPFNIDWCDDTGRNNRAAGAGAANALERVSCVIPQKPLTITLADNPLVSSAQLLSRSEWCSSTTFGWARSR